MLDRDVRRLRNVSRETLRLTKLAVEPLRP